MDPSLHNEQPDLTRSAARSDRLSRPWGAALLMVGMIGAFFLLREHWNHVLGVWPYLLLLACPLMHLFHGHGGHRPSAHSSPERDLDVGSEQR